MGGDEQGGPSPRDLVQEALIHHVNIRILRLHDLLALLLHLVYKHTNITMCSTDEGLVYKHTNITMCSTDEGLVYEHTNITMCSTDEGPLKVHTVMAAYKEPAYKEHLVIGN